MNEQLESDLRAALRARAGQVPAAAVTRLTGLEYRPRTRRWRPPVTLGALAAAGAAASVAVIASLGAGTSNAFAGWSPKPTAPAPGQLAAAQASCESGQSPIAGLPLELSDTRGPFTFSVYANSTSSATCIQGPSFSAVAANLASSAVNVPAGQVLLSAMHRSDRGGQRFAFAEGRTGAGVTALTLTLGDDSRVQATVGNGWFVAWWPGGEGIKSAELTTPAGPKTQTFNLSPEIPCSPSASCTSDASGGKAARGRASGQQTSSYGVSR